MYLYFRKQFSWDAQTYGLYVGIFGVMGIIAQYLIIPFMSNRLKFNDMTIGRSNSWIQSSEYCTPALIAVTGVVTQQLVICFTPMDKVFIVYLASCFSVVSVGIPTLCRSLITKCVKPSEVGKLFSVLGALQVRLRTLSICLKCSSRP